MDHAMTEQTPEPTEPTLPSGPFTVRPVTAQEAQTTLVELGGSFLQTPAWARTKPGWTAVAPRLVRRDGSPRRRRSGAVPQPPRLRRSFAYLPEGPALPWDAVATDPGAWIDPLVAWATSAGAFALRLGFPVVSRSWHPSRQEADQ